MNLSFCILLWLCWCGFTTAQDEGLYQLENHNPSEDYLLCRPVGDCEPCPRDVLQEPFCQPFGNRRLMHCINETLLWPSLSPSGGLAPISKTAHDPQPHPEVAWQSCGRIVRQERADFFEFVGCNVVLAIVAMLILLWRSKRMHIQQTRQLAARIRRIRG